MFCKNCGKEIEDGKELCDACQAAENNTTTAEPEIATQVYSSADTNTNANQNETTTTTVNTNTTSTSNSTSNTQKSKIAAGLFGIFLGSFGVHNFYLGYTGKAVAQLLITLLTCGFGSFISAVWGLIEGILILAGSIDKDAQGNPLKD